MRTRLLDGRITMTNKTRQFYCRHITPVIYEPIYSIIHCVQHPTNVSACCTSTYYDYAYAYDYYYYYYYNLTIAVTYFYRLDALSVAQSKH